MKTTLHIKVDKDIKVKSAKIAAKLGLPLSAIVNASLRNFIKTETFSVSTGKQMTPYMESWLAEIDEDIKAGKNLSPAFHSAAEMDKYLNAL